MRLLGCSLHPGSRNIDRRFHDSRADFNGCRDHADGSISHSNDRAAIA